MEEWKDHKGWEERLDVESAAASPSPRPQFPIYRMRLWVLIRAFQWFPVKAHLGVRQRQEAGTRKAHSLLTGPRRILKGKNSQSARLPPPCTC